MNFYDTQILREIKIRSLYLPSCISTGTCAIVRHIKAQQTK